MSAERRRTIVTVVLTVAVIAAVTVVGNTAVAGQIRALVGWDPDRGESSTYVFLATEPDGDPVTWRSCRPIRYSVDPDGAPSGWEDTLAEAMAQVTAASGLSFEDAGPTRERYDPLLTGYGPRGDRPVVVIWATPREVPRLEGTVVGLAGPVRGPDGFYTSGRVVFDAPAFARMERMGEESEQRAIAMHELAHLVGLDHVADDRQIMHPSEGYHDTFGKGDLEGLRLLGAGPCR